MQDYCRRSDTRHISLGFQPANPVTFDINFCVLSGLIDNPFDKEAIRDLWKYLAKFYETCSMCKPNEATDDQVKL